MAGSVEKEKCGGGCFDGGHARRSGHSARGTRAEAHTRARAGSGFTSAALASAGHDVVAIDLVDACVESIARLADDIQRGSLAAIAGDFYSVEVEGSSTSSVTSMGSASAPTTTSVACCAGSLHGSPPAAAPSSTCSPRGTGRRCPVRGKSSRLEAESSTKKGSTPKVVGWLSVCGEKGTKTRPSPVPPMPFTGGSPPLARDDRLVPRGDRTIRR
jgi:hypothetical protein